MVVPMATTPSRRAIALPLFLILSSLGEAFSLNERHSSSRSPFTFIGLLLRIEHPSRRGHKTRSPRIFPDTGIEVEHSEPLEGLLSVRRLVRSYSPTQRSELEGKDFNFLVLRPERSMWFLVSLMCSLPSSACAAAPGTRVRSRAQRHRCPARGQTKAVRLVAPLPDQHNRHPCRSVAEPIAIRCIHLSCHENFDFPPISNRLGPAAERNRSTRKSEAFS